MNFSKLNLTNHKRQLSSFNESSHPVTCFFHHGKVSQWTVDTFIQLWDSFREITSAKSISYYWFCDGGSACFLLLFVFLRSNKNFLLTFFFPVSFLAQVEFHDSALPPLWRPILETAVVLPRFFPASNVLGELSMVLDLELCLTDKAFKFVMFWEMLWKIFFLLGVHIFSFWWIIILATLKSSIEAFTVFLRNPPIPLITVWMFIFLYKQNCLSILNASFFYFRKLKNDPLLFLA